MANTEKNISCILCLGSNCDGINHLNRAENELNFLFPGMEWGQIIQTAPEDIANPSPFFNRAARMKTSLNKEQLTGILKRLEQSHGRTPEKKAMGLIPLDIDLLCYGEEILKPADMEKHYVKECLDTLPKQMH